VQKQIHSTIQPVAIQTPGTFQDGGTIHKMAAMKMCPRHLD